MLNHLYNESLLKALQNVYPQLDGKFSGFVVFGEKTPRSENEIEFFSANYFQHKEDSVKTNIGKFVATNFWKMLDRFENEQQVPEPDLEEITVFCS